LSLLEEERKIGLIWKVHEMKMSSQYEKKMYPFVVVEVVPSQLPPIQKFYYHFARIYNMQTQINKW
jgi:hypothetical protein